MMIAPEEFGTCEGNSLLMLFLKLLILLSVILIYSSDIWGRLNLWIGAFEFVNDGIMALAVLHSTSSMVSKMVSLCTGVDKAVSVMIPIR